MHAKLFVWATLDDNQSELWRRDRDTRNLPTLANRIAAAFFESCNLTPEALGMIHTNKTARFFSGLRRRSYDTGL